MSTYNVITAGPSAGKSSTIRELSARGYMTLPESARLFINQKISEGEDPEEIREKYEFQKNLIEIDKKIENNNLGNQTVFMDRSLADNIAYMRHNGEEPPEELFNICEERYDNIFLLERLDFEDDEARNEDEEEAEEIHTQIREAYLDLGYSINEIPVVSVSDRVDMILDRI